MPPLKHIDGETMNIRATIDTTVLRPFFFRGVSYNKDDIFEYNPNSNTVGTREQYHFIKNGRVKEFSEKDYLYISLRDSRNFLDKTYNYGDIVNIPEELSGKALLYIKRGQMKKIHKDRLDEFNKLINKNHIPGEQAEIDEKNTTEEPIENINSEMIGIDFKTLEFEEGMNLSKLSKRTGLKAKDLKYQINKNLNIEFGSYTQKFAKEEFDRIYKLINKKSIKWVK